MIGKLIGGVVGIFGATILFWAGIAFEHRPAGFVSFHVWGPIGFTDPGGPAAQLATFKLQELEAGRHNAVVAQAQSQVTQVAGAAQAQAQARLRYVYVTLTKEIPGVVTPAIDRAFPLPVGFLRVHDAAARGLDLSTVRDPAGRPDDVASGVPASAAAAAIAANYGACRQDDEQLAGLQAWLKAEAAAAATLPK